MADKNAEVAVEDNGGMKKTLSLWNFFTIGFGAIIGTGWVLQVGDWMVVGGGPVPAMIAFLLGAIFLVPVGAVFGELTAAIPISGGIVEYVDRSFGRTMSYITGWLQAFLTKALLCGMLLAMGVSLFTGSPEHAMPVFSQVTGAGGGKPATEGTSLFAGIVSVLVLTPFFYAGFDTIPQQAEEAAEGLNWNKFGKIISLALLAAGGFYMVCIYSFGTILDWHEFVKSPVPALACLKGINMLLYLAMLVIATLGPMGPMNSFYGATSRIMLAMGRKGQLPEKFAEVDPKSGAPKLACAVLGVITVIGPFLGKNMLIPLTNVSALAFIFSCGMVALACLRMRFTEPDLPRPYEVPGGKFGISLAVAACAVIIGLLVVPFSPASLNMVEWSIVIGWLAVGLALMAFTNSRKK